MTPHPFKQVPAVYHRQLGDVLVTGLSDGYMDMGYEIFRDIPEDEVRAILAREHRIAPPRISINVFALRFGGKTYLVDCGSQHFMGPTCGRLMDNLAAAGITAGSVDGVILTHVHPDHSNGLTDVATGQPIFPNAEVIVHQAEIDHWYDDAAMARATERQRLRYFQWGREQLNPYRAADKVKTFRDGEILPGIIAVPCPGHTPGHCSYVVSSGSQSMIVWGDTVHVPEIQLARPEVAMQFDTDPERGVRSRQRILDMVIADDLLVAGMHVHFPGFGHMRGENGGYSIVAEQWAYTA
ncbi:MBL fold metallo-hydrolase [Chelatococcus asaccharovorans]|uniref:MBL fold metallo-hydrolase n=1 Tax=Chelatococcus asaccharovorans TaxID=28210 RepID=UPI00224C6D1D|nr:MBL fold metallo-hydrolase [Chelatococcus asaccharovorans]CAH1663485.1 Metallo-beta-lactamase superfamily protein [Chelatococcus asaccharovorans]CAH1682777.1 Metallo-beta-lactamase superfamily protein [Chelatococcus asaccharovorans]